ncbi:MAG: Na/Pi cotransporter family protein [Clostridiales bacterium]|nr:Na/Pi cotransporter family protein [Clostridiales bacterium]
MTYLNYIALAGGIGMFLYGIKIMGEGLELAAGNKLKKMLEKITSNKIVAVLVGATITALIQSSAATTVMVVGFVNTGLMQLSQAVGVIMGANIGTTMTSVLISLNLSDFAPIFLLTGVVLIMFSKKKTVKFVGQVITGFGLLFLGIHTMSSSMAPLKDSATFQGFLTKATNPLYGIVIGFIITAIMQSSSASIGVLQSMAIQGIVPIGFSAFVLYGQEIGSCVPTLISTIGTKTNSKRAAIIHLLFNCFGAVMFIVITMFTPYLEWIKSITDSQVVQISIMHILFKVVNTVVLLPFSNWLVKISCKLIPEKEGEETELTLEYLDDHILTTPPIAVLQAGRETLRMAFLARNNLSIAANMLLKNDLKNFDEVMRTEELINFLNHQITHYLVKINALEISREDAKYIGRLFHVVNDIERIGDHAQNIAEAAANENEEKIILSETAKSEMRNMLETVLKLLDESIASFEAQELDITKARYIEQLEDETDALKDAYQMSHIERLNNGECGMRAGMLFINTLTDFERVGDHAENIAWAVEHKPSKQEMEVKVND